MKNLWVREQITDEMIYRSVRKIAAHIHREDTGKELRPDEFFAILILRTIEETDAVAGTDSMVGNPECCKKAQQSPDNFHLDPHSKQWLWFLLKSRKSSEFAENCLALGQMLSEERISPPCVCVRNALLPWAKTELVKGDNVNNSLQKLLHYYRARAILEPLFTTTRKRLQYFEKTLEDSLLKIYFHTPYDWFWVQYCSRIEALSGLCYGKAYDFHLRIKSDNVIDVRQTLSIHKLSKHEQQQEECRLTERRISLLTELTKAVRETQTLDSKEYKVKSNKLSRRYAEHGIIACSPKMIDVFERLSLLPATKATVLIQGETGTGKELVAKAIHSEWAKGEARPFISVNCAAIPKTVLESELFGHVKGAFTDAKSDKKGYFELADRGTLFLDQIESMNVEIQGGLLRAIDNEEIRPVGSEIVKKVNVRIIAATNQNLDELISKGDFRNDLYYRLNIVDIHLPPLRERGDDVHCLLSHFLEDTCKEQSKPTYRVNAKTLALCKSYPWPGNVRELKNQVKKTVLKTTDEAGFNELLQQDLEDLIKKEKRTPPSGALPKIVKDIEKSMIEDALSRAKGIIAEAARLLGMKRTTLESKIKKLGIVKKVNR